MAQSGTKIAAVRETRKGATIYKTNERPGTRAQVRYVRVSAYKAREVLDLVRGKHVVDADEILQFTERDISNVIRKALASAVANATNNDSQDPEALFVSACYADEGPTLKRWRPRARGRATRIRKRTCHITVIVARLPEAELRRRNDADTRSGRAGGGAADRASRRARVAQSKQAARAEAREHDHDHDEDRDAPTGDAVEVDQVTLAGDLDGVTADDVTSDLETDVETGGDIETDIETGGDIDEARLATGTGDIKGNADSMKYHVPGSQWYDQTDAEVFFETAADAEAAGYEPAGSVAQQQPEGAEIKGNFGSMKYHVPGSQWYDQTDPEVWFATTEEAEAAGYEPAGGADKQDVDLDADEKDEN